MPHFTDILVFSQVFLLHLWGDLPQRQICRLFIHGKQLCFVLVVVLICNQLQYCYSLYRNSIAAKSIQSKYVVQTDKGSKEDVNIEQAGFVNLV